MKKMRTKKNISVSLNPDIYDYLDNMENKSKYVEHLIYQDLMKNSNVENKMLIHHDC